MKFFTRLSIFLLFLSIHVFAQSPSLLTATERNRDGRNFELELTVQATAELAAGMYLKLPVQLKATPAAVRAGGQDLWLKQDDSVPQPANAVHWQFTTDGIILRIPAALLGSTLSIRLNSRQQSDTVNSEALSLYTVQSATGQPVQAGREISHVLLFQNNNEVR